MTCDLTGRKVANLMKSLGTGQPAWNEKGARLAGIGGSSTGSLAAAGVNRSEEPAEVARRLFIATSMSFESFSWTSVWSRN